MGRSLGQHREQSLYFLDEGSKMQRAELRGPRSGSLCESLGSGFGTFWCFPEQWLSSLLLGLLPSGDSIIRM